MAGYCGLRQVERFPRAGKAAGPRHHVKNSKFVPIHCHVGTLTYTDLLLAGVMGEETISLQRRHTSHAGGGDGLAIDFILHIARGKHTGD